MNSGTGSKAVLWIAHGDVKTKSNCQSIIHLLLNNAVNECFFPQQNTSCRDHWRHFGYEGVRGKIKVELAKEKTAIWIMGRDRPNYKKSIR